MEPMEGTSDPPSSSPCPASKKPEGQAPKGGSPVKPVMESLAKPPKAGQHWKKGWDCPE